MSTPPSAAPLASISDADQSAPPGYSQEDARYPRSNFILTQVRTSYTHTGQGTVRLRLAQRAQRRNILADGRSGSLSSITAVRAPTDRAASARLLPPCSFPRLMVSPLRESHEISHLELTQSRPLATSISMVARLDWRSHPSVYQCAAPRLSLGILPRRVKLVRVINAVPTLRGRPDVRSPRDRATSPQGTG